VNEILDGVPELPEAIRKELGPRPTVQVLVLTINGQKVMCLGPVLHVPTLGIHVGDVQEIEFGEIIPANLAVRLLDGSLAEGTVQ
jgi:hypothetical protein